VSVVIALTLPLVIVSYSDVDTAVRAAWRDLSGRNGLSCDIRQRRLDRLIIGIFILAFVALLLVKGLYPDGSGDYFNHYFPYYREVVERGNLWPNELWVHYFYDKGAGPYFLGMLIADPMAPQLVTFSFTSAAALVLLLAGRDAAPGTRWPLIAVLLFLIIYEYTPGWGEFEKTHELMVALVLAAVWASAGAFAHSDDQRNVLWPVVAVADIIATVICAPTLAAILGSIFGILFLIYLLQQTYRKAALAFLFGAVCGILVLGTCAVNYATTGSVYLTNRTLLMTASFTDFAKLNDWGALFQFVATYWKTVYMSAVDVPWRLAPKFLIQCIRLDLLYPLSITSAVIGAIALSVRVRDGKWEGSIHAQQQLLMLLAVIPVYLVVGLMAGRVEPHLFYRYSTFVVPLLILGGVSFWCLPIAGFNGRVVRFVNDWRTPPAVFLLSLCTIVAATHPKPFFTKQLPLAARFAVGELSLDGAYSQQPGWYYPWGAIYPGSRAAYSIAGPGAIIWSFHNITSCMLPDCRVETLDNFILPKWDQVMFDDAEYARRILQDNGFNYFLFVRDNDFVDYLPKSPLFSPDNIAQYLGIAWTDGASTLLTWLGPGVQPLGDAWLAGYRDAVEHSDAIKLFPYEDMKRIFKSGDYAALFDPKDPAVRARFLAFGRSGYDGWTW
jgi:hypothetical protein